MNAQVEARFDREITKACQDFGDHDYMKRPRILRWIDQFAPDEHELAIKILNSMQYYSSANLISMASGIVDAVRKRYSNIPAYKIFYVPIGGPGSGSQMVVRHLRGEQKVKDANIVDLFALHRHSATLKPKVFVFLEDFSGTGKTIKDWWDSSEPIILPIGAEIVFGILVLNEKARKELGGLHRTIAIQHLDDKSNVFSDSSTDFTSAERLKLVEYCEKTGCSPEYVKGFGECGLLVAFQHGCPNNSLPVLWYDSKEWESVFRRRAG